ncbi:hypothetical protein BU077_06490, partial [Staphylococcus warneri]
MANNTFKINTYLNSNDTKISFDGELEIYSSEELNKSNFIGNVQVQVKGQQVAKKGGEVIHRRKVSTKDLKAYQIEGGVYYFVVYIIVEKDNTISKQVYGRQLHQLYLNYLLQKNQKSVTIEMYEIKDANVLYKNCVKYLDEKKSQGQINQIKLKGAGQNFAYITTPENIVLDTNGLPINDFYGYT